MSFIEVFIDLIIGMASVLINYYQTILGMVYVEVKAVGVVDVAGRVFD